VVTHDTAKEELKRERRHNGGKHAMPDDVAVVEVDSRRRVSLGKIGRPEDTRYIVQAEEDGSITLTPAVVMSAAEAKLLRHPELVNRIQQQIDEGKRFPRPKK
jgi:hypothetical protein